MNISKIYQKGIICVGKHLHIHILFLPILLAAYLGNYLVLFSICWISALLHEFAHIFVLRRFGIPVSHIVIQPFGVCAKISTAVIKNPVHEILMALAGPFINLIISVLCFIILQYLPISLIEYCMAANLSIFCLNLLPCLPLDGGRVMRALLTLGSDAVTALKISVIVSRIIIALLPCRFCVNYYTIAASRNPAASAMSVRLQHTVIYLHASCCTGFRITSTMSFMFWTATEK